MLNVKQGSCELVSTNLVRIAYLVKFVKDSFLTSYVIAYISYII